MEMRKKERELSRAEAMDLLERGEYGVLSLVDGEGCPYGVPMSYALEGDCIYLHGVRGAGHRWAAVQGGARASFTVVGETEVLPGKFSTRYESVIAFGTIAQAEDGQAGLMALVRKYSPDFAAQGEDYARRSLASGAVAVYVLRLERVTGKARRAR